MRIGGFVIHGNNIETLSRCLDDLISVCDEVVTIDSYSNDGSADLVKKKGLKSIQLRWQGYGAARAVAVQALQNCDYLFFLDADEKLATGGMQAFSDFRHSAETLPYYRFRLEDWAELSSRRFRYRTEHRIRLIRSDVACWNPSMIVHEALLPMETGIMNATIEHQFATSIERLVQKQEQYALLWAIRARAEGRRAKPALLNRLGHLLRDCLIKGAIFRGQFDAVRLAWAVSRYHGRKHELLSLIYGGAHNDFLKAYDESRFEELFRMLASIAHK